MKGSWKQNFMQSIAMIWLSCDTAENFENYKKQNEY